MFCCHTDFIGEAVMVEFSMPQSMSRVSLSMLLQQVSVLVKLLLINSIDHSTALSGASFL